MRPTRRTQPYRKGKLGPTGPSLSAMLRGAPAGKENPVEGKRRAQKRGRRRRVVLAVRRSLHNRG
jgi:hypothetical protein